MEEVTEVVPLLLVDTAGVNDPPGVADEGIFEIVGVGDPVAPARGLPATCKPTIATRPLSIAKAVSMMPARRKREPVKGVAWITMSLAFVMPGFQCRADYLALTIKNGGVVRKNQVHGLTQPRWGPKTTPYLGRFSTLVRPQSPDSPVPQGSWLVASNRYHDAARGCGRFASVVARAS